MILPASLRPSVQTTDPRRTGFFFFLAAWGTAVRMEPKAHLGQSYNKQPDVYADSIGKDGTHYCGDVKVVCVPSAAAALSNY